MSDQKTKGNEPANPVFFRYQDGNVGNELYEKGLTKREIFAMSAMNGIVSNPNFTNRVTKQELAQDCVEIADALLVELNKE